MAELIAVRGDHATYASLLERLEGELADVGQEIESLAEQPVIDLDAVRGPIRDALADLGSLLRGTESEGQRALRLLFGESRLRISRCGGDGFSIEGDAMLDLNRIGACSVSVVAGTGFEPATFGL